MLGPGGTGKTRLALECASSLLDRFKDGAWFVDLSTISDGAFLESTISAALRLLDGG